MISEAQITDAVETYYRMDLAEKLQSAGFNTSINHPLSGTKFDIVAVRGDEKIAFYIKSLTGWLEGSEEMMRKSAIAKANGYKFELVVAQRPKKPEIELEKFDEKLLDYLVNQDFPENLMSLSSHTTIEGIADTEYSEVRIADDGVRVTGSATVEVGLSYGGGQERDGLSSHDAFPLEFDVRLDHELGIVSAQVDVDTDSFYEGGSESEEPSDHG